MTRAAAYKSRLLQAEKILRETGVTSEINAAIEKLEGAVKIDVSEYEETKLKLLKRAASILGYHIREFENEFEETKILMIDFLTLD